MNEQEDTVKRSALLGRMLKIGIPILISAALVIWILHTIEDPKDVWEKMKQAALWPLLAVIPVSMASHVIRAWRWRRFIGRPVSGFYAFTSVMIGYAVNDVLPRVGEVARVVNMNRLTKVPIARLLSTLLAERLLDVIALVVCLGISFLIQGEEISEKFPALAQAGPIALVAAAGGLLGLFLVAYYADLLTRLMGKGARRIHEKAGAKVEELIRQGADGLQFLRKPSNLIPVFLETSGIWVLYWASFLLGLAAFGILDRIGYSGGTVAFSITCSGVLVPTMGAIGAYHEIGRECLIKLFSTDPALALASITVIHAVLFYVVGGLFGVLAWGLQAWVKGRTQAKEEG
jgi:uncharacterized protein (TIRG00374 family)